MDKKCIFIILIACILVLGACFSPWKDDGEGTVSINIGGGAGRAAYEWSGEEIHTITLSGGPGPEQSRSGLKGGATVHFSVVPGQWTITVLGFTENDKVISGPYTEGSLTLDIKPGPNGSITIPMSFKVIKTNDYTPSGVPPGSEITGTLRWAIEEIAGKSSKNIDIVIDINGGSVITLINSLSLGNGNSVTIRAKKPVTIQRDTSFTQSFFTIQDTATGGGGTLTLGGAGGASITLDGGKPSITAFAPLITVNSGTLVMNEGIMLQNNNHIGTTGANGGGVIVNNGSTFIMNGGVIMKNEANSGGGVYVGSGGKFYITNGIIYGGSASSPPPESNTAISGHALYVDTNGLAQYGAANNWKNLILPNGTGPINDTILVVNGQLQP